MAGTVYTEDLKSSALGHGSSNLPHRTNLAEAKAVEATGCNPVLGSSRLPRESRGASSSGKIPDCRSENRGSIPRAPAKLSEVTERIWFENWYERKT